MTQRKLVSAAPTATRYELGERAANAQAHLGALATLASGGVATLTIEFDTEEGPVQIKVILDHTVTNADALTVWKASQEAHRGYRGWTLKNGLVGRGPGADFDLCRRPA